jgi:ribosome maturation factor RimP
VGFARSFVYVCQKVQGGKSMAKKGKKTGVTKLCTDLARPVAAELGLMIWDVRFEKEGGSTFLRYFIDKPEGVTMEDCERFSRAIDGILDAADPIEQSYYLEVSSPGIERSLKTPEHFAAFIGRKVTLKLYQAREGRRELVGILDAYDPEQKSLSITEDSGQTHNLLLADIAAARQYAEYNFKGADR